MSKTWKLSKGKYAYITDTGKRGIASTLEKAKQKARSVVRSKPQKVKKRKMAKKTKRSRSRSTKRSILGNMSLKGMLINTAVMTGIKIGVNRLYPRLNPYADSIGLIGTGVIGNFTGTGKSLLPAGVIDLGSEIATNFIQGTQPKLRYKTGGFDF